MLISCQNRFCQIGCCACSPLAKLTAPFGFFYLLFFFFLHYLQHKSCDHLLTVWWGSLLFQRRGSCVVLNPWLLPTSCLIADLIPTWWLCNVSQAQGPNLSIHVYWYCIDLKDSKPQITSPVTLAVLCWILHGHIDLVTSSLFMGMGGRLQNEYTHTHTCIYVCLSKRWSRGEI